MDILDEPEVPDKEPHWLDPWSFVPVFVIIVTWKGGAFFAELLGFNPQPYVWLIRNHPPESIGLTVVLFLTMIYAFVDKSVPNWARVLSIDGVMLVTFLNIDMALLQIIHDGIFAFYVLKVLYTFAMNIQSL